MMETLVALELQPIRAMGLQQALADCGDLRLAASEMTPELALKRVAESCPAVVLVDGDLGAGRIASFLKAIRSVSPGSQPVLWIPQDGGGPELEALASSGIATLERTAPVHRVLEVLLRVARNPRDIAGLAIGGVHFTVREQEILDLLCQGLKNSDIAGVLRISPSTVKVHLAHMYDKSGIHNRGLLAANAKSLALGSLSHARRER
jgi:two-component system nitrate/nitrite response regulator NarL